MHLTFPIRQSQQSEYLLPQSSEQNVPQTFPKIFVHFEISHVPGGFDHLADSNCISKNLTIDPDRKIRLDVSDFIRRAARSAIPLVSDRWSEVVTRMIILHSTCQNEIKCTYD